MPRPIFRGEISRATGFVAPNKRDPLIRFGVYLNGPKYTRRVEPLPFERGKTAF